MGELRCAFSPVYLDIEGIFSGKSQGKGFEAAGIAYPKHRDRKCPTELKQDKSAHGVPIFMEPRLCARHWARTWEDTADKTHTQSALTEFVIYGRDKRKG